MKKIITAIFLALTSCSYGTTSSSEVNTFVRNFNKYYPKNNNLQFEGVGLSYPDDKLLLLDLAYVKNEAVDIASARIKIVNLMQEALSAINSDSTMKPILKPFPFTTNELDLRIAFHENNGKPYTTPPKNIYFVLAVNNSITYYIKNKEIGLTKVFEEPYSEAYEKVMGKKRRH